MSCQARTYLLALLTATALLALAVQGMAAQQGGLDEAAKAVVRIRGCDASGCQRGVGSGVMVDPSGLIVTANHVTLSDPNDPLSSPLGDFVIVLTEDFRLPPEPLYRARLAASDREHDLALLQIYGHEIDGSPVDRSALTLSTLPLHILGYPLVGGRSINYVKPELSGFEETSLIKVTGAVGQGYIGGPALVVRDGEYHVAGVVIRQRGLALGDIGLIRTVDELPELSWKPDARRVWIDDVDTETANASDGQVLSIAVDLSAVDFAGHQGRILAYLYDGATRLPWKPDGTSLPTSASGQVVLSQDFRGSAFIDRLNNVVLTTSAGDLAGAPEDLALRLVVWDMDEMKALWRDPTWRRVERAPAVVALSATDTPTETGTPQPTDTPVPPTSTFVPTSTDTATPMDTATATETSTPSSTPTHTSTPSPTVTSTPHAGATKISAIEDSVLVYIPSGQFNMGMNAAQETHLLNLCDACDGANFKSSMPLHNVYTDSFWIHQTEVTNRMYEHCVEAGVCRLPADFSSETRSQYWGNPAYSEFPVVHVDWFSADQYCRWINGRLPTEAEWEKAARGFSDDLFPWGSEPANSGLANLANQVGDTVAVGSYLDGQSPFGVLDMAGNVWEWVNDWYEEDYYSFSDTRNPIGPPDSSTGRRVGRGGSWYWDDAFAGVAFHDWWEPENHGSGVGFRCVQDDDK